MVWGCIRVAIFTGSFLIGLMFFGSDGSSASVKAQFVEGKPQAVQLQCTDRKMVLTYRHHRPVVAGSHFVGM
jgi:hypothetical protein